MKVIRTNFAPSGQAVVRYTPTFIRHRFVSMPLQLPDDDQGEYYMLLTCSVAEQLPAGFVLQSPQCKRYCLIFLRGLFTLEEAVNFSLATSDMQMCPPTANAGFFAEPIFVHSLGISCIEGDVGLPDHLRLIIDRYRIPQWCNSYDWHLCWHLCRQDLEAGFPLSLDYNQISDSVPGVSESVGEAVLNAN